MAYKFLLDKIIELAPRWLHYFCYIEDEEEEEEEKEEEEKKEVQQTSTDVPMEVDSLSYDVLLASGSLVNMACTEPLCLTGAMVRSIRKDELGYPSRFLVKALHELRRKHELRRNSDIGIYVTKHELHKINKNSFFVRKIYITPCTILYEGPYREERCPVTRKFAREQEGFLRVSFRDEGLCEFCFYLGRFSLYRV